MEEKYRNPRDAAEIVARLKECPTLLAVKELISEVFPDLIKNFSRGYSSDYPALIKNWHVLCQAMKTLPKGLVLIEFVPPSVRDPGAQEYSLLRKFLDTMTLCGFVARRELEFRICGKCRLAIPCHTLYQKMKFTNPELVPKEWDIDCAKCEAWDALVDENQNPVLYRVPKEEIEKYIPKPSAEGGP